MLQEPQTPKLENVAQLAMVVLKQVSWKRIFELVRELRKSWIVKEEKEVNYLIASSIYWLGLVRKLFRHYLHWMLVKLWQALLELVTLQVLLLSDKIYPEEQSRQLLADE